MEFVAVGDLMIDVVASGRGHDARIGLAAGGSAANAGVWAASLGASATVVGRVGDDLGGRALRVAVEERGATAAFSVDPDAPTGTFMLADGDLRADRGANARFEPGHLPAALAADAVLVSGYLPPATVEAAVARARAPWIAVDVAALAEAPAAAVLANEDEARRLTGAGPEEAVRLLARGRRLACVKLGAHGAVAVLDGRLERAAGDPVEGGRGTGAGDAFAAGLLVALARGLPLDVALRDGCRCGALAAAHGWPSELASQ